MLGFGDSFFQGFEIIFFVIFALTFGIIIFVIIKGVSQWNKNNNSPRLTVNATVVTKRTSVSHHHHHGGMGMHMSCTTHYYVTFQVESGDRMELSVSGMEYGELAEGDSGKLTFQGTRYLDFERIDLNDDSEL